MANQKSLAVYCGSRCLDCFRYKGRVADLARDPREELRGSNFRKLADFAATTSSGKAYEDYYQRYEVLGAMVKFRCKKDAGSAAAAALCLDC